MAWLLATLCILALAGCGSSQSPSDAPLTPTSALATSTAGPPSSPTPDPDHAKATAALTQFTELIKSPTLTMHLEQTATVGAAAGPNAGTLGLSFKMDRSGQDFAGTIFLLSKELEIRSVGGTGYGRAANGAWTTVPIDPGAVEGILNPWQYMGPVDDLRFLNRTLTPQEAFIFGNSQPIDYQTAPMRAQGFVGQLTSLRFVVRADGVPIELTFNGEVIVPGARVTLGSTLYASRVGEPITIEKPVP